MSSKLFLIFHFYKLSWQEPGSGGWNSEIAPRFPPLLHSLLVVPSLWVWAGPVNRMGYNSCNWVNGLGLSWAGLVKQRIFHRGISEMKDLKCEGTEGRDPRARSWEWALVAESGLCLSANEETRPPYATVRKWILPTAWGSLEAGPSCTEPPDENSLGGHLDFSFMRSWAEDPTKMCLILDPQTLR